MDPRAIAAHRFLEFPLHLPAVSGFVHVDKVDDHQPGEIAQAQLPCNLFGGFEVGRKRRFLDGPLLGRLARVHVHGHECFGLVHHQITAGLQSDYRIEKGIQLLLSFVSLEQGDALILVLLDALGV